MASQALTSQLESVIRDARGELDRAGCQWAATLEVFPGLHLPVAGIGDLLAVKILARDDQQRPQDSVDIRSLIQWAAPEDLETAKSAVELITERGYNRHRDLVSDLAKIV